jgi:glycosyltransferase involved in cell wall biosynthesis
LVLQPHSDDALETERDLVSVIIPTYNRANLVRQAVQCLLDQSWKKIQIIVVDDGSTDDTEKQIGCLRDVLYIRQENAGPAAARNKGVQFATGELISTIDSDDLWNPNFLEESVKAIRTLDVDLVFSNWIRQNADGQLVKSFFETNYEWWQFTKANRPHWRMIEPQSIRQHLLDSCIAPTSAWVFKRELIEKVRWTEATEITDDWGLLQDVVLSKPCRVAVNMQRSWLKRVQQDNICDLDGMKTRRAIEIDSPRRVLTANGNSLTRKEKARLYRRLAMSLLVFSKIARAEPIGISIGVNEIVSAFIAGMANAPIDFIEKVIRRTSHSFPPAPAAALEQSGLLEDLSTSLMATGIKV